MKLLDRLVLVAALFGFLFSAALAFGGKQVDRVNTDSTEQATAIKALFSARGIAFEGRTPLQLRSAVRTWAQTATTAQRESLLLDIGLAALPLWEVDP